MTTGPEKTGEQIRPPLTRFFLEKHTKNTLRNGIKASLCKSMYLLKVNRKLRASAEEENS